MASPKPVGRRLKTMTHLRRSRRPREPGLAHRGVPGPVFPPTTRMPVAGGARRAVWCGRLRRINLEVSELHIDFDCAEAKLAGLRLLGDASSARADTASRGDSPPCLVVEAFGHGPSWSARLTGTFLQVHSLDRPSAN